MPEDVIIGQEVIPLAGDERQVGMIFQVLQGIVDHGWEDQTAFPYFKGVLAAVQVNNDLFTVTQFINAGKWTCFAVGISHMCGDDRVADPGGESGTVQPAGILPQPGHIPVAINLWYTHDSENAN